MSDHETTVELPVTGMTCASCVARVERAIGKSARRGQGERQPGDREGDRDVRPRRGLDRRPGRRHRGRRLRRGDRAGDAADHRHDLRELRGPGGEGPAQPAGRAQGRRQPGHREGHGDLHPRPGELPRPRRGRARRRLRRRGAGAGHRRGDRGGGGGRRRGRPRRRLPQAQAEGHRRLRAQRRHLRRHDADGLVHVPAGVDAQRLPAVGAGQRRCSSGWAGSSTPPPGRR